MNSQLKKIWLRHTMPHMRIQLRCWSLTCPRKMSRLVGSDLSGSRLPTCSFDLGCVGAWLAWLRIQKHRIWSSFAQSPFRQFSMVCQHDNDIQWHCYNDWFHPFSWKPNVCPAWPAETAALIRQLKDAPFGEKPFAFGKHDVHICAPCVCCDFVN